MKTTLGGRIREAPGRILVVRAGFATEGYALGRREWVLVLAVILAPLVSIVPVVAQEATPPLPPLADEPLPLGNGFELLYVYPSEVVEGLSTGPVLLGEMRNTGDQPAVAPVLRIGLLDAAGAPLGFVDAMPLALYALPGARIPIVVDALSFKNAAPGVTLGGWVPESIAVCDTGLGLADVDPAGLEIRNVRYQIQAEIDLGTFGIEGSVTNLTGAAVPYLEVVAPFYAPDGRFVGFDSQAIVTGVAPGSEVLFALGALRFSNMPGLLLEEQGTPVSYDLLVRRQQRFQPAVCGTPIT